MQWSYTILCSSVKSLLLLQVVIAGKHPLNADIDYKQTENWSRRTSACAAMRMCDGCRGDAVMAVVSGQSRSYWNTNGLLCWRRRWPSDQVCWGAVTVRWKRKVLLLLLRVWHQCQRPVLHIDDQVMSNGSIYESLWWHIRTSKHADDVISHAWLRLFIAMTTDIQDIRDIWHVSIERLTFRHANKLKYQRDRDHEDIISLIIFYNKRPTSQPTKGHAFGVI